MVCYLKLRRVTKVREKENAVNYGYEEREKRSARQKREEVLHEKMIEKRNRALPRGMNTIESFTTILI